MGGSSIEYVMLISSFLLLAGVFASKASVKLGIPALLLFLGIGMLMGSDGPGRIEFNHANLARALGTVALAYILFAGGLDTNWEKSRSSLKRAFSLATVGVLVSAVAVGIFGVYAMNLKPVEGLLLGAIIAPTDAAAVFAVLRARRIGLQGGLGELLELESGFNDPMAVFLTIGLAEIAMNPATNPLGLIPGFAIEMVIGGVLGYTLGLGAVWLINHLRLEFAGLYSVTTLALAGFSFGLAASLGGSGFLAVYLTGIAMARGKFIHRNGLVQFHDGLAWVMQIGMFVMLGLLVFPHELPPVIIPGISLAAFLIFVARPVAVFFSLLGSRNMTRHEKVFVSWTGLRGATPIILATIPLTLGLPKAHRLFNLVFFVVLASVALQGMAIGRVAKRLKVLSDERSPELLPMPEDSLLEIQLSDTSTAVGRQVVDLHLPATALVVLLTREGNSFLPQGTSTLLAGDTLMIATRKEDRDELSLLFESG